MEYSGPDLQSAWYTYFSLFFIWSEREMPKIIWTSPNRWMVVGDGIHWYRCQLMMLAQLVFQTIVLVIISIRPKMCTTAVCTKQIDAVRCKQQGVRIDSVHRRRWYGCGQSIRNNNHNNNAANGDLSNGLTHRIAQLFDQQILDKLGDIESNEVWCGVRCDNNNDNHLILLINKLLIYVRLIFSDDWLSESGFDQIKMLIPSTSSNRSDQYPSKAQHQSEKQSFARSMFAKLFFCTESWAY